MIYVRARLETLGGPSVTYGGTELLLLLFLNRGTDFWWRRPLGSHSLQIGKDLMKSF